MRVFCVRSEFNYNFSFNKWIEVIGFKICDVSNRFLGCELNE